MTEGSITKKLVAFAAVTSTGSLIFLLVGFINGMFVGNNVIVGKRYHIRHLLFQG